MWYNPDISNTILFYPIWFKNSITFVGDVTNNEGQIMRSDEIESKYGFKLNFLEYYRLKILLTKLLNKLKIVTGKFVQPCIPHNLAPIIHSKNVTKTFYNILNDATIDLKFKHKWIKDLELNIQEKTWEFVFHIIML